MLAKKRAAAFTQNQAKNSNNFTTSCRCDILQLSHTKGRNPYPSSIYPDGNKVYTSSYFQHPNADSRSRLPTCRRGHKEEQLDRPVTKTDTAFESQTIKKSLCEILCSRLPLDIHPATTHPSPCHHSRIPTPIRATWCNHQGRAGPIKKPTASCAACVGTTRSSVQNG